MKLLPLTLSVPLLALASALAAQDAAPRSGLSDLEETIGNLSDEAPGSTESTSGEAQAPQAVEEAEATPPADTEKRPAPVPVRAGPAPSAPPLTRAEQAELERVAARGRKLIATARAGILATQDMLTRISDPEGAGITGWIAEPEGNGMGVTFFGESEAGPRIIYRASVLGGRVVSRDVHLGEEGPKLNPLQAQLAAARAAASGQERESCAAQFNILVLPPEGKDDPISVYHLTPASAEGFPIGGHYRTRVARDGTIVDSRAFASGCARIAPTPATPGKPPEPIGVTHLLDPMPTEIHPFIAQLAGRPLLVATGDPQRIWLVTPDAIREVRP